MSRSWVWLLQFLLRIAKIQQQAHSFCREESRAVKPQRIRESAAKAYRLYSVYTGSSSSVKANRE